MNLIWHITQKDLRKLLLPIAGFAAALVAKIGVGCLLLAGNADDGTWFSRLDMYLNLCVAVAVGITLVIVATLVHEDAVIGSQVFWRTRPITGRTLLASKLLSLALIFGLLPVLIAIPWWLYCGFGFSTIVTSALEILLWQAAVVLPALGVAVICDNLGRYITLIVAGVGIIALTVLMQQAYLPFDRGVTWNVVCSRSIVALVVMLGGLAFIIGQQFLASRKIAPYVTAVLPVIAVSLVVGSWRYDLVGRFQADTVDTSELTRAITVTSSWAEVQRGENDIMSAQAFYGAYRIEGLGEDFVLATKLAEVKWTAHGTDFRNSMMSFEFGEGGRNLERNLAVARLLSAREPVVDPETQRWQEQEREERLKKFPRTQFERPLTPEEWRKLGSMRFPLVGTERFYPPSTTELPQIRADFVIARPEKIFETPIRVGSRIVKDGVGLRITGVRRFKLELKMKDRPYELQMRNVDFIETQSEGALPSAREFLLLGSKVNRLIPECWAFTPDLGDLIWGGVVATLGQSTRVSAVQITWRTAAIREPHVIRNGIWTSLRADWDEHVSLVLIRYRPEAEFRRMLNYAQVQDPKARK